MKIIIIVDGGNLDTVFCSEPDVEVEVIDYDNDPKSTSDKEDEFKKLANELYAVY